MDKRFGKFRNKNMRICLKPKLFNIVQNKRSILITLRYYLSPIKVAKILKFDDNLWARVWGNRQCHTLLVGI